MDYSQKISERQWNLPDKGELESRREATYIDDIVQKDHIQRKLLERLDGIMTASGKNFSEESAELCYDQSWEANGACQNNSPHCQAEIVDSQRLFEIVG